MENKRLAVFTAVGLAAAIAVPTIAFGNARSNQIGTPQAAQTPYVTRMLGANEVPNSTPGSQTNDPDGFGSAAVTFDLSAPGLEDVCWDLSYGNLTGNPLHAHIHGPAAVGVTAPPVIEFDVSTLGATSATGCRALTAGEAIIAADIVAHPTNYYVNAHTSDFPGGAIRGQLAAGPAPTGESHMLPLPLRAYDSRDNSGVRIAPSETRTVSLASGKDAAGATFIAVPPGATAAIVTLTVTDTTVGVGGNGGFLKMYSAAVAQPATSSINWAGADQNVAVTAQVAVDASGQIKITDGANATHFVVDVIGYLF